MRKKIFTFVLAAILIFNPAMVMADMIFDMPEDANDLARKVERGEGGLKEELRKTREKLEDAVAGEDYAEKEAIVLTESEEEAEQAAEDYGGKLVSYENGIGILKLKKTITETIDGFLNEDSLAAENEPETELIPRAIFTFDSVSSGDITDEYYSKQYHHSLINDASVWDKGYSGENVKVCIIDTGISTTSEVYQRVVSENDFTDTGINDTYGHGTHIAGIVAAPADGEGVVGVAPEADLYIAKVSTGEKIYADSVFKALQWAMDEKVDIVNMSFCTKTGTVDDTFQEYLDRFYENGIVAVAAMGNYSSNDKYSPACLDKVIAVASCDSDKNLSSFSNYGDWADIVAPGTEIYSTYIGKNYMTMSGTSMSTPVVVGALALLHQTALVNDSNDDSEADEMQSALESVKTDEVFSYNGNSVTGGIDLSKFDSEEENDENESSTEEADEEDGTNESSTEEADEKDGTDESSTEEADDGSGSTDEGDGNDESSSTEETDSSESSSKSSEESSEENSYDTVDGITYPTRASYTGTKPKLNISVSYNGVIYSGKSVKVKYKNYKNAGQAYFTIVKIKGNREATRALKGTTIAYTINPLEVTSSILQVKKDKSGAVKKVKVSINGKYKAVKKSMWTLSGNTIVFSGNYTGTVDI